MSNVEARISKVGKYDCCGCKLCEEICPQKCISMKIDKEGFWYPVVDLKKCIQCGLCNRLCPNACERNCDFEPQVYAASARNKEICKSSSSGGIFQLLARETIAEGGVVYGAAYDSDLKVHHMRTTTLEELEKLYGSKYVQSDIKDVYQLIRQDMNAGKKILFSGTPCQVAAVKSYINNDDSNIIFIDLICHGVPSPVSWKECVEHFDKGEHSIEIFKFRTKEQEGDWENLTWELQYRDGEKIRGKYHEFTYGKTFLNNLCLRPSCYECGYLALSSGADITLGDYWRIKQFFPECYNTWGVSVVCLNSPKGKSAFEKIKELCDVKESDVYYLEQWNGAFASEKRHYNREMYVDMVEKGIDRIWSSEQCTSKKIANMKKIVLIGSYNLRVAINETKEDLVEQYSYSSLKSIVSRSPILEMSEKPEGFVGQMLYKDKYKCFIKDIERLSKETDYLVIDLLEERFPVKNENEILTTQNIDYFLEDCTECYNYATEYNQWEEACDVFIDFIKKYFGNERIIFVESYLCSHWGMHGRYERFKNYDKIERFNQYLKRSNDYFIQRSGVDKIVRIPEKLQYAQKYHRFGCKPYHLNYDAYQKIGKQLREYFRK